MIRRELWFGLSFMALIVIAVAVLLLRVETITDGHLGLLMLSLVVVAIMLGFPTAFTLMGMGMIFTWFAYNRDVTRTLDLMVQSAYKTMSNDVLIAVPLFVKVAPDLEPDDFDTIARIAIDGGVDGLIVSNTTISRPALGSPDAGETGGLSGVPLKPLALVALQNFARATGGELPLVAAGGIASGADAYARIRAGASAVQLYSALIYNGPGLVARIKADLAGLLRRDGFASVAAAIGA